MKTTVITVGREVLSGHTINTNLQTIAIELKSIGIDINRCYVIDDVKKEYHRILDMVDDDLIIFTGGLGPTVDDLTRETVIGYYGVETMVDQETLDTIKQYFDNMEIEMKDTNNKQALFPVDSIKLTNDLGTAPGVYFTVGKQHIILFPGPPHEMKPLLRQAIDIIKDQFDIHVISRGFKLVGTGESYMEHQLKGFYGVHPKVNIAPYASIGEIKYIFTAVDTDALDRAMKDFYNKFHEFIYGNLEDTLEEVVVRLLQKQHKTISFAESCTGGLLASTIVNVPGSSTVFKEGLIVYSNEAKMKYLGVSEETLMKYGAVSEECVTELCTHLYEQTDADITVSVSGIAGPSGGTLEKPVGLVYFGICHNGKTTTYRRIFNGNREMIRMRAVTFALNHVRLEMLQSESYSE